LNCPDRWLGQTSFFFQGLGEKVPKNAGVLHGVGIVIVVEEGVHGPDGGSPDRRNDAFDPRLQLLGRVVITIKLTPQSVEPQIKEIRGGNDAVRQAGMAHSDKGDLMLLEELFGFRIPPRGMAEFQRMPDMGDRGGFISEKSEKTFQTRQIWPKRGGKLPENHPQLLERCHPPDEFPQFSLAILQPLQMRDASGSLHSHMEVGGHPTVPAGDHRGGGEAIEGGVDFHRVKLGGVKFQSGRTFYILGVELAAPIIVSPAGRPDSQIDLNVLLSRLTLAHCCGLIMENRSRRIARCVTQCAGRFYFGRVGKRQEQATGLVRSAREQRSQDAVLLPVGLDCAKHRDLELFVARQVRLDDDFPADGARRLIGRKGHGNDLDALFRVG